MFYIFRSAFYFTSPKKYNGEILINFEPQRPCNKKPLLKTCSDGEIIRRKNMEKEEKESTVSDCEICYQNISDDEEHSDKSSHTSTKPSSSKQLVIFFAFSWDEKSFKNYLSQNQLLLFRYILEKKKIFDLCVVILNIFTLILHVDTLLTRHTLYSWSIVAHLSQHSFILNSYYSQISTKYRRNVDNTWIKYRVLFVI